MTLPQKKKKNRVIPLLFGLICLLLLILFIISSRATARVAQAAIILCGRTVIPTLFPVMVINGLLMKSGSLELICSSLFKNKKYFLGINGALIPSLLIGLLCGFPTGGASVWQSYCEGGISGKDAQKALFLSSLPSPAFTLTTVGVFMLGNARGGIFLWLNTVICTIIVGTLLFPSDKCTAGIAAEHQASEPRLSLGDISGVIRDAVQSVLGVCGTIVFFSVISGFFAELPAVPPIFRALLASFFELGSGIRLSSALLSYEAALVISAFALGWSGISVHTQIASVTRGGIKMGKYLVAKLITGVLCASVAALFLTYDLF